MPELHEPARRSSGLASTACVLSARTDAIGTYWRNPETCTFAELLIDCEEDRTLRAVLVGMLREAD